jgi:hypothetical protein
MDAPRKRANLAAYSLASRVDVHGQEALGHHDEGLARGLGQQAARRRRKLQRSTRGPHASAVVEDCSM